MNKLLSALGGLVVGLLVSAPVFAQYGDIIDPAESWDHLWGEVLVDLTVIGVVFGIAAVYMLFKFRAKNPEDVGTAKTLTLGQAAAWALIPAFIFMADDFFLAAKGWSLWNIQRRPPENAMEIKVTGYQWYFEFDYGDGVVTEDLVVPVGQPVVMRMTSEDVVHSFGLPEYRVTEDLMPGRITYLWFYPKEAKTSFVTCREFCGISHSSMYGEVRVVPRDEFEAWLANEKKELAES